MPMIKTASIGDARKLEVLGNECWQWILDQDSPTPDL